LGAKFDEKYQITKINIVFNSAVFQPAFTGFWWRTVKERDHWRDPSVDGRIILRWIFRMWDVEVCTRLGWLGIETGDGHL
jgi:hypothetical protein